MTLRPFMIVALLAALAAAGIFWERQWEAQRRLREQEEASRRLVTRLNSLEMENLRLSNVVAQANTPLADVQLAELARLQDEVRALRKRTNDLQRLQAEIRGLRAKLTALSTNASPDVPAADIFPRDAWAFAGYDTPEAAVESVTWAISQGDQDAYLASLAPALRGEMEGQLADGSFADMGPMEMSDATGYRIVNRQSISDHQEVITIHMDGQEDDVPLGLYKTPDGWKVIQVTPTDAQ